MTARAHTAFIAPHAFQAMLAWMPAVPSRLRRLAREDRGGVAILIGLALPVLAALVFLVAESAVFYVEKRRFQAATDAAAISAAMELQRGFRFECFSQYGDICGRQSAMEELARRGIFEGIAGTDISVSSPAPGGSAGPLYNSVEVAVSREIPSVVGALLLGQGEMGRVRIAARAVSVVQSRESACALALALNGNIPDAIDSQVPGAATLHALDCAIVSNSTHDQSVDLRGIASLAVQRVWSAGGYRAPVRGVEASISFGPQIVDPYHRFVGFSDEEFAALCPNAAAAPDLNVAVGQTAASAPGCYRRVTVSGGTLELAPGLYVIQESLRVRAGAMAAGEGVTLLFSRRASGFSIAGVILEPGAITNLVAPRPGQGQRYTGILMLFDPFATPASSPIMSLIGGTQMRLAGAIYAPAQQINFAGGPTTHGNPECLVLIGSRIVFLGDGRLATVGCEQLGTLAPELPQVRLVE